MKPVTVGLLVCLALITLGPSALSGTFSYLPAGDLKPGSGQGTANSSVIHVTNMRFPIEEAPAYAQSMVYNTGGAYGPAGSQCAASNYDYPWRDNYCETRSHDMPLCPAGTGHQGQDIRPSTCEDDTHWVVAAENGTITVITNWWVVQMGTSGVRHSYLHMSMDKLEVTVGEYVTKGQRLGLVSDDFGGTSTHIHLHYHQRKYLVDYGNVYVSPYMNLVDAYEALIAGTPESVLSCIQAPVTGAENEMFKDVPPGLNGKEEIEALANAGITHGCNTAMELYCPDCPLSRAMVAAFVVRAAGMDTSNVPDTPTFNDVPVDAWYYPYVETIAAAGIVQGCDVSAGLYCPNDPVTRQEMAKFMVLGSLIPEVEPDTPTFNDVPDDHWSYPYIEALAAHCVVGGCNEAEGLFCPTDTVTRRVAAFFVARTFDLHGPDGDFNPCIEYCDPVTCNDTAHCEDWGQCAGFSDQCDETGTQSRACVTSECTGTLTNGTCSSDETTESQGCTRDTDGDVVEGWGEWSICDGFDGPCDTTGTQAHTQTVCSGGVEVVQSGSQECTREVSCPEADSGDAESEEGDGGTSDTEQVPGPVEWDGSTPGAPPRTGSDANGGDAGQAGATSDSGGGLPGDATVPESPESTASAGCQQGARGPLAFWMVGGALLLLLSGVRRRRRVGTKPPHGRATS